MTTTERRHRDDYEHLAPLFDELADGTAPESHRRAIRARLVTGHLPVAEHIALRFRNRGQPQEDLEQVATVGLINAIDRFDPSRGNDFLAFAVPTITGEIRRYFRDSTWALRVPRRLKELHSDIHTAAEALGQRLGRSPRPSELATETDLSIEDVHAGLQAGYAYRSASLDGRPGAEPEDDGDGGLGVDDHDLKTVEDREALYPALATLPEREASIVVLRFFGNMTQSQIAERVGISQMHVSRLLAASLAALRDELTDEPDDPEPVV